MSVWKDKQKGYWRFGFQYLGKRYTGSRYKTRRDAESAQVKEREKAVLLAKEINSESTLPPTGMDFYEASKLYLDYAERRFVKKTYSYKATILSRFLAYIGPERDIDSITPGEIIRFLQTRNSNNSYNIHRKELSALFTFIRRNHSEFLEHNPCINIERMPHTVRQKEIPSEEEVLRMIMATDPQTDERDLFLCCLHTLGRIDELLRLTWQDVNFESRTVTLWTRKRRGGAYEPDPMPMNKDLYDVLLKMWKIKKQDKYVFWNEKANEGKGDRYKHRPKFMAGICKRAGIQSIGISKRKISKGKRKGETKEHLLYYGFHNLRHFMASYLADHAKVGTQAISKLLRHKNLRTTEIYLHSLDESQRAAMITVEGKFTSKIANPHSETTLSESNTQK